MANAKTLIRPVNKEQSDHRSSVCIDLSARKLRIFTLVDRFPHEQ